MRNRNDPESAIADAKRNIVGKYVEIDAAITSGPNPIEFVMIGNPENAAVNLISEAVAETCMHLFM